MSSATRQLVLDQSFRDVDAVREQIAGWDLDLLQLERGPFLGRVRQWRAGSLFLSRARFERKLSQRGASRSGGLTLAVPASDAFDTRWRGQPARADHIMVFPTNGEFDAVSSSAFDVFTITLVAADWSRLLIDAGDLAEQTAEQQGRACRCSAESMRQLRRALRRSESAPDGQAAHESMTIPMLALEAVRTAAGLDGPAQSASDRRRTLRAAVRYIDAKLQRTIRVADLCRATGVSERTLQYAFRAEFGLSPMSYLNVRRLHRVRAELLRTSARRGDIARIARAHGLRHAGRFAAEYHAMFGELPSHTVRRADEGHAAPRASAA